MRLPLNAEEFGYAIHRQRVFDVMVLKALVDPQLRSVPRPLQDLESVAKASFLRYCAYTWKRTFGRRTRMT